MNWSMVIFTIGMFILIAMFVIRAFDGEVTIQPLSCPQTNISLTQEFIESLIDPSNYIQPYHTDVKWFYDKKDNQLVVNGITGCNGGQGMSMQPTMFEGNVVCFQEFKGTNVKAGDIIQYTNAEGRIAVHRVRAAYDSKFGKRIYVQGDGLPASDVELISINDIKAKVVLTIYE